MCGISGYIKLKGLVTEDDKRILEAMNARLVHRGPDANTVKLFDQVALAFTRLSIIGLSNGMQPIVNEDESLVLICNGEIFNYIELREELRKKGHIFNTDTDVEVIVHLYEEHGMNFLNQLNGQFAFALYDKKIKKLYCVRDQMGIAPLYYTRCNEAFVFASEIKAILEHPAVNREADLTGLDQVLTFPGLISPRTAFKNISSLENGHYLEVDKEGNIQNHEYWDLVYNGPVESSRSEADYIDELEALLQQAVRLRLRSDVTTGFYLSGGLDSSAIAMKIHQLEPSVRKDAFSIAFPDSEISEAKYQAIVANAANAIHHTKTFHFNDISERLRKTIYHCECPIKETYNTASIALSESVRASGIKVILSGEGADEFFAGYVGYRFDKMRALDFFPDDAGNDEREIRDRVWGDRNFIYERNFKTFNEEKRKLYASPVNDSFNEVDCLNHPVVDKRKLQGLTTLQKRSYIDYKTRMVDHLVSDHGDRMALANSVEVRYPFLDKNLVEFSTTVPCDLKLNDFTEKYIVKKMAARFVPLAIVEREKFGFVAPGSPYLLQHNCEYINDLLSYDLIKRQGFFNPDEVERLKKIYSEPGYKVNVPFENDLLIVVITFGILLDTFFSNSFTRRN